MPAPISPYSPTEMKIMDVAAVILGIALLLLIGFGAGVAFMLARHLA